MSGCSQFRDSYTGVIYNVKYTDICFKSQVNPSKYFIGRTSKQVDCDDYSEDRITEYKKLNGQNKVLINGTENLYLSSNETVNIQIQSDGNSKYITQKSIEGSSNHEYRRNGVFYNFYDKKCYYIHGNYKWEENCHQFNN